MDFNVFFYFDREIGVFRFVYMYLEFGELNVYFCLIFYEYENGLLVFVVGYVVLVKYWGKGLVKKIFVVGIEEFRNGLRGYLFFFVEVIIDLDNVVL